MQAKCDGLLPICTSCKGFGETTCVYDKPASIAYVRHLEKKVQQLSRLAIHSQGSSDSLLLDKSLDQIPIGSFPRFSDIDTFGTSRSPEFLTSKASQETIQDFNKLMSLSTTLANSLSEPEKVSILGQYSNISRRYEDIALQTALQANFGYIPFKIAKKCLDVYWAWLHPIYLCIYRPAFYRDMATYSPANPLNQNCCYSPVLLSIIFSATISLIYGNCEIGKIIDQHSHTLLMQNILLPPSLATVAAALHRAVRSMEENNTCNIWMFSGITNRLAEDINLFRDPKTLTQNLTVQDFEARARLAWSTFYWDKNFSLYLGRLPSILLQPFPVAGNILDYSMDLEPWNPIIDLMSTRKESAEVTQIQITSNSLQPLVSPTGTTNLYIGAQSISRTDSKGKTKNSSIVQNAPITNLDTASMQIKFGLLKNINAFIESLYGNKSTSLISGNFDLKDITQFKNKPTEFFLQAKLYLQELTRYWDSTSGNLKVQTYPFPQSGILINPAIVANSLIYHASLIIVLTPLIQLNGVVEDDEIDLGISATENVIQLISSYISSFGRVFPNYWHAYSPYLASQFLLLVVQQNRSTGKKNEIILHLQSLLPILRRSQYQFPNIAKLKMDIEKQLSHDLPSQSQIGEIQDDFKSSAFVNLPVNMPLQMSSSSYMAQHSHIPQGSYDMPYGNSHSRSGGNEAILQFKQQQGYIVQNPQLPVLGLPSGNLIHSYNPAMNADARLTPYFLPNISPTDPSQAIPQQYTQQMNMPAQIPTHHLINSNTQYTLTRMPVMSDLTTDIPTFLGQFSPTGATTVPTTATNITPPATTSSADQDARTSSA